MIEKWATIQRIAMSLLMVMVAGQPFANASLVSEKAGGVYIPEIAVEEKVEQADSRGIVAASETRFSPITAVKVDDEGIETQYAAVPQVEDIKSGAELEPYGMFQLEIIKREYPMFILRTILPRHWMIKLSL